MFLKSEELWNQTIMLSVLDKNKLDFIDCAGTAWPLGTFPIIPARSKDSKRFYPSDGDGFRAGKIEYDALAISVIRFLSTAQKPWHRAWDLNSQPPKYRVTR